MHLTGYIFATHFEAEPFINGVNAIESESEYFRVFTADKFVMIISGIGKVNAAAAASYLIAKYSVRVVYNIGSAGAINSEYKISDILHIKNAADIDSPKFSGKARLMTADMIDGYATATLATQDKPAITQAERQALAGYDLVDMEGAAVLQICRIFNVKCYIFKIVSDTHKDQNIADIINNIKQTAKIMYDFFIKNII